MDDKDDDGDCLGVVRQEGKAYCEATSIHGPAYLTEGHWRVLFDEFIHT